MPALAFDPTMSTADLTELLAALEDVSIPAAITGGESPTEAEHNALRAAVEALRDALVALTA